MKPIKQDKYGTPAEKAAFDLVRYFKVVLSKEHAPACFTEDNVKDICGIVENIVKAAVDEAESRMCELIEQFQETLIDVLPRLKS